MRILVRLRLTLVAVVCGAALLAAVPGAAFAGTGWVLSTNTYPTNLVAGVDGVQEVTPEGGTLSFTLSYEGQATASINAGETNAGVQAALEGVSTIGKENVKVTAGAAPGSYKIEFVRALGNEQIGALGASGASVGVLKEGDASGTIGVTVLNVGSSGSGGTITFTDRLPAGLRAKRAGQLLKPSPEFEEGYGIQAQIGGESVWDCSGNGPFGGSGVVGASVVSCVNGPSLPSFEGGGGYPTYPGTGTRVGYPEPPVGILVEAVGGESTGANVASISGGGASVGVSEETPVTVSKVPAREGLSHADYWVTNENGEPDTQAGSHPYLEGLSLDFATALQEGDKGYLVGGEVRNLETRLPPGFIGNLSNFAQCTHAQLLLEKCPPESVVGVLHAVDVVEQSVGVHQLFNIKPEHGTPAELGFNYQGALSYISFGLGTGGENELISRSDDLPELAVQQIVLELWGFPQQASHHPWRGHEEGGCRPEEEGGECAVPLQSGHFHPIFTLPTACGVAGPVVFRVLSGWQHTEAHSEVSSSPLDVTGCEDLSLEALFGVQLQTDRADTPTGLEGTVTPGLGGLEEPLGDIASEIQATTVTLPEGLVVNPGQATGLTACGAPQNALTTEAERAEGKENDGPVSCPESSKVGTAIVRSPLLDSGDEKQLEGNVYVLPSNPPEIKLLLAVSADGINIKSVGVVHLNETTGQVTTTFEQIPQAPFSELKLRFEGGSKAALATPAHCGMDTATALFTPWSSPFTPEVSASGSFQINEATSGGACLGGSLPFAPALTAGSTNAQAGGFTTFSTVLARGNGQQRVERLQVRTPAGFSGMISSVPLCGEPQAAQGTCSSVSQIGHAVVTAGPGSYPLTLPQPGDPEAAIYLTGPYGGAPFGLSIVTPVIAGPFNLGTIITRARLEVDPYTAQATITTDPLPAIVKGVPTDLRSLEAVIDRPGFAFNPTSCAAQNVTGTAWGTSPPGNPAEPGQAVALSTPFQIGGCKALEFKPKFTVSTSAKTSKANGASLTTKLSYPVVAEGTEANIARVKVDLPKQLPSRLTTLQKACTAAQFEANPAGCPAASFIGYATVHTPELPVALKGPAIFVSHGGEAFPSLTMVLQGDGVTIELVGATFISKSGVTSTTFKTVPDQPFSTFELTLPEGKYSALTANGSLCAGKLAMPTEFVGQNGAEIHESTPISVAGCAKAKKTLTKAQKLAKALKACHTKKGKTRARCEAAAHKQYGHAAKRKAK